MGTKTIIAWDLGATKCAAAIVSYALRTEEFSIKKDFRIRLKECESIDDLVNRVRDGLDMDFQTADAICIGAAGTYDGKHLVSQNGYPFPMDFARIKQQQNWPTLDVVHDYVPIVCATFTNYMQLPDGIRYLHHGQFDPYARRVALGVGTGLGLKDGVLFQNGDFWLGSNELGHIGLIIPPDTDPYHIKRHRELQKFMRSSGVLGVGEPLTFEKILSGKGMVRLHQFITGLSHDEPTPEVLGATMQAGEAQESKAIFAWYLGLLIGSVQLMFMPQGGIWVTGGVIQKHLDVFDFPDFYKGIKASPAYMQQREKFPLGALTNPNDAFMGCGYYAVHRLLCD